VIKLTLAKEADVFSRLESFSLAVFIYIIEYIQEAASNNVRTYAAAQIFYAAGSQGLQILQQIWVADTTNLLNRALFSVLFDLPFLWIVWAGPPIAQRILDHSTWRWGYGIRAIVLPAAFIPLAIVLLVNQLRAKRQGKLPPSLFAGQSAWQARRKLLV
jgi:MFS family permease